MSGMVIRAVGLIVAAGLVLTGCTGSPPESDVSSATTGVPTPAASASPSPSLPAKPERPEAMKRKDAEGAAAAAEYFIELYPYVMATGDTKEFEAMSHRACGFCSDALEQAESIQARHETWTGGEIQSTLLEMYERDAVTGIFPLDLEVEQAAANIADSEGVTVFEGEDERSTYRVEAGRRGSAWVIVEIALGPAQ